MREDLRAGRQEEIAAAAYDVLREKGYLGMSMLAVAKRAQASNETLYRWFGDKRGLCLVLVARNTDAVRAQLAQELEAGLAANRPALDILHSFGPILLTHLLAETTVALYRAAASDPTGAVGSAISGAGREQIFPLIRQVMRRARRRGALTFDRPAAAVTLYLALLVGETQLRRVIGQDPEPDAPFVHRRSEAAFEQFVRLVGV